MKKTIIILGMDNTGKTTLAKDICRRFNYLHISPCGPGKSKKEMKSHMRIGDAISGGVVYERYPLFEEMVYGKVLRGKSKFNFKSRYFKNLLKKDPLIIYCRPDVKTILKFGDREQMPGVISKSSMLIKEWDYLIQILGYRYEMDIKSYDYEEDSWESLLK